MMAPLRSSPSNDDWHEGQLVSVPLDLSVYPTDDDDELPETPPALFDAKGEPLRYVAKEPFGFTGGRSR